MEKRIEYPFGTVTQRTHYHWTFHLKITGVSNIGPNLINDIDTRLWKSYWEEQCRIKEIDYIHNTNSFDFARSKGGDKDWTEEEINPLVEKMATLVEFYNKSAEKYNVEIAEPFIKKRKSLLDSVLGI
jgi:hypothetical protein